MAEPEDVSLNFSDHENSRAAAKLTAKHRAKDRARIVEHVAACAAGATCDEIEQALDMRHQTCGPRCTELKRDGLLAESGVRRKTRSGALAAVLVLGTGIPNPKPSRRRKGQLRPRSTPLQALAARKVAQGAYEDFVRDWRPAVEDSGGDGKRFKYELDNLIRRVREVVTAERDAE